TLPIGRRDVFSAHKNFTIFGKLELAAGQDFTDRTFRRTERMIQADQRSCFRHAIPLNYGVAHALEETLGVIRERGAAGNEGPEFPAKAAMNPAEHPGAAKEFSPVGPFECAVQPRRLTVAFQIAFQPR